MNFLGEGVPPVEQFLFQIRRVATRHDFFRVCEDHLDHENPMTLEPAEERPSEAISQ
jgi:tRNA-dihydrouridine synthase B